MNTRPMMSVIDGRKAALTFAYIYRHRNPEWYFIAKAGRCGGEIRYSTKYYWTTYR